MCEVEVMRKRITAAFLAILLSLAALVPTAACAAQSAGIIQNVQVSGSSLTVLCAQVAQGGEYTLQLDGTQLPFSTGNVDLTRTPVTVFCLVDISETSYFRSKVIREVLLEISASLGSDDRMLVATLDSQLNIQQLPDTPEDREAAMETLSFSHKDADLYQGILKSLEQLSSDESYSPCRCLVVLSDGDHFQGSDYTQQEVLTAIEKARLPVYTVALAETYTQRQGARTLGSLSRSSCGGKALSSIDDSGYIRKDVSGTTFGRTIWEDLIGMPVLTVDLSGFAVDRTKTALALRISCTAGNNVYEDSLDIPTDRFPAVAVAEETKPSVTEAPADIQKEAPREQPASAVPIWIWVVAGVVAVAGVAVAAILLSRKKQPQPQPAPEAPAKVVEIPAQAVPPAPAAPKETGYHLYLTDIPHGTRKRHYRLPENRPLSLGRDGRADEVLNAEDKLLSGTHFSIVAQAGAYRIRDERSRNGTFLNGVPIGEKGWCSFHSGDKLRAGSCEYRIVIQPDQIP